MEATYRASIWKLPIDNSSKLFILQRALTDIMYKANINYSILKERLDVLVKQGLLEERTVGKRRAVYTITEEVEASARLNNPKTTLEHQATLEAVML